MIDQKKIEEAAEKQIETIQPYSVEERLDRKEPIFLYEKNDVLAMLKSGINWFLDNLWHDASEEPEKNRELLVEHHQLGAKDLRFRVLTTKENTKWSDRVANFLITRWLYMEDLMKGGKK